MRPKQRVALRKLFSLPPIPNPSPTKQNLTTSLEQKFSYGDIQKHTDIFFQSASRMQFFGVKKWCSSYVFSDTKQKNVPGKFVKSERFLTVFREHIIFNVK